MLDVNLVKRDIETLRTAISLELQEVGRLTTEERENTRVHIANCIEELENLYAQLGLPRK